MTNITCVYSCVHVYLGRFWLWGSAGKCHLAARHSCPGQRKSLVWGHSYKPFPQPAHGWVECLSSPSLLHHPPGEREEVFLLAGNISVKGSLSVEETFTVSIYSRCIVLTTMSLPQRTLRGTLSLEVSERPSVRTRTTRFSCVIWLMVLVRAYSRASPVYVASANHFKSLTALYTNKNQ